MSTSFLPSSLSTLAILESVRAPFVPPTAASIGVKKVLGETVLVLPGGPQRVSSSGLILTPRDPPRVVAWVIAVSDQSARLAPDLIVGARVLIRPHTGSVVRRGGWEFRLIKLEEILALLPEDAEVAGVL